MNEDERKKRMNEVADQLEYMKLIDWAEDIVRRDRVQNVKNRFYNLAWDEKQEALDKARLFAAKRRGDDAGGEEKGGAR